MKALSFLFFLLAGVYAVDELHILVTVGGVQELPVPPAKIDALTNLFKLALQNSVNASYLDATVTQTQPAGTTQQVMLDFNLNKIPAENVQSMYAIIAPQFERAKFMYGRTIASVVGGTNLVDLKSELKPQAPTPPPPVVELHILVTVGGVQELPVPQAKIDNLNHLMKIVLQGSVDASYLDTTVTQTQPAGTTQQVMLDFHLNKIPAQNVQSVYAILAPQLEAAKTTYGSVIASAAGGTNLVVLKSELKYQAPTPPPPPPTAKPTSTPTQTPTAKPTLTPTQTPTANPTSTPTQLPTANPTSAPTQLPTAKPTQPPTEEVTSDAKQVLPVAVGFAFLLVSLLNC